MPRSSAAAGLWRGRSTAAGTRRDRRGAMAAGAGWAGGEPTSLRGAVRVAARAVRGSEGSAWQASGWRARGLARGRGGGAGRSGPSSLHPPMAARASSSPASLTPCTRPHSLRSRLGGLAAAASSSALPGADGGERADPRCLSCLVPTLSLWPPPHPSFRSGPASRGSGRGPGSLRSRRPQWRGEQGRATAAAASAPSARAGSGQVGSARRVDPAARGGALRLRAREEDGRATAGGGPHATSPRCGRPLPRQLWRAGIPPATMQFGLQSAAAALFCGKPICKTHREWDRDPSAESLRYLVRSCDMLPWALFGSARNLARTLLGKRISHA
jgi:hypothetical protein